MVVQRATDVMVQELDGEFLLLRAGSPDVLHLDHVASDIWRLLASPASREQLAQALAEVYGEPQTRVAADLGPALDVLLRHGVVVEAEN